MEKGGERQTLATWKGAETNRRNDGMVGQLFHKFEVNQETVWNVNYHGKVCFTFCLT